MKYFILIAATCFLFGACKKSSSGPSNTELITSATWKYESGGLDPDKNGTIDVTIESLNIIPGCLLDNTGKFNSDGTGINDEGATKCSTTLPQTTPFGWSFLTNETILNITGSGFAGLGGQFKIRELSSVKLSLTKDTSISGFSTTLLVNLKH
jgi:hypothetical protein